MEIGEYQLSFTYKLVLALYRLFYLYNHIGNSIYIFNGRQYFCACRSIGFVTETTVHTGCSLNIHNVTVLGHFLNSRGGHSHAVLIVLNLFWNTDNHSC